MPIERRSARPTIAPSFDVAEYARDSERLTHAGECPEDDPPETGSEVRRVTRPRLGQGMTDDAWARQVVGSPRVTMNATELRRLPLDHRAGFALSLMDGSIDLDTLVELLEMSGIGRSDVLSLVRNLSESGVVDFR